MLIINNYPPLCSCTVNIMLIMGYNNYYITGIADLSDDAYIHLDSSLWPLVRKYIDIRQITQVTYNIGKLIIPCMEIHCILM